MNQSRIESELDILRAGGQDAKLIIGSPSVVKLYRVSTGGVRLGLPGETDVIVPVPEGYPASQIDLAGLPMGSPFIGRAKGSPSGGPLIVDGSAFQMISYHPYGNAGGGPWDQMRHGFHTYYDWILTWLAALS